MKRRTATLLASTTCALLPVWFVLKSPVQNAFPHLFAILDSLFITAGIAILRYRLYDIDVIINRTLVYGVLSLLLGLIYFSAILLSQAALRILAGGESSLAVVASTLVIAALFNSFASTYRTLLTAASTARSTTRRRPWKRSRLDCARRRISTGLVADSSQ